jgi:hypothetical protein
MTQFQLYSLANEWPFSDNSDPMFCAEQGCERLCWSSWPCTKCNRGLSAIGHLINRIDAGSQVSANTPEEIAAIQAADLRHFASICNHSRFSEVSLPKIAQGSEHLVFFNARTSSVLKITRVGIYGESYYLVDNVVNQRNCSPLDYLLRLRFWRKLFQSAPKDVGITDAGQIVSTHRFVTGDLPTQDDVDSFLVASGMTPVRKDCWLWKKEYPGEFDIWLGDARADNFVQTAGGIVPIDIRLWQT